MVTLSRGTLDIISMICYGGIIFRNFWGEEFGSGPYLAISRGKVKDWNLRELLCMRL